MRMAILLLLAAAVLAMVPRGVGQINTPTLTKMLAFDLPGPPGKRFDYLTIALTITTSCPRS